MPPLPPLVGAKHVTDILGVQSPCRRLDLRPLRVIFGVFVWAVVASLIPLMDNQYQCQIAELLH